MITNIIQARQKYIRWLTSPQALASASIIAQAQTCALHINTLAKMRFPPQVLLTSAHQELTKLEALLNASRSR